MTTFNEFVLGLPITNDPRGNFIGDTQRLIRAGLLPNPSTVGELLEQIRARRACREAEHQAVLMWNEYQQELLKQIRAL